MSKKIGKGYEKVLKMQASGVPSKIAEMIEETLSSMGYGLVRVRFTPRKRSSTLQIMAEPADGRTMTVEDCERISKAINPLLDVEDPFAGAYHLEVSSPGIDRPLVQQDDFKRFAGFVALVETKLPMEGGRKRFKGMLKGLRAEDGAVLIEMPHGEEALPFDDIREARLVLTEELIAASLRMADKEKAAAATTAAS